jgi:hypothetical protein
VSLILWSLLSLIDPDLRWRGNLLRRCANEAFWMSQVGGIQNGAALFNGAGGKTVVTAKGYFSFCARGCWGRWEMEGRKGEVTVR